jgi:hypothetical protein
LTASERRILGIDFSGASDAGRKIWIAEGRSAGGGAPFNLIDLRPACDLEGGAVPPAGAIAALARHIVRAPNTVAGFDFPFSIPAALIEEPSWVDFLRAFPARFPDPDAFRDWALTKANGRELRRAADRAASTPFNSYNLRIYRQTWWGIAALLNPLVTGGAAIVRPYQRPTRRALPILTEACPACSLKSIGFYPPYKGRSATHRRNRQAVVKTLIARGHLAPPPSKLRRIMIDNVGGDALDAVVAALAAAEIDVRHDVDQTEMLEGRIYWRMNRPS